jgi:hypothetical protein
MPPPENGEPLLESIVPAVAAGAVVVAVAAGTGGAAVGLLPVRFGVPEAALEKGPAAGLLLLKSGGPLTKNAGTGWALLSGPMPSGGATIGLADGGAAAIGLAAGTAATLGAYVGGALTGTTAADHDPVSRPELEAKGSGGWLPLSGSALNLFA